MPLSLPSRPGDPELRRILLAGQPNPGHGLVLARSAWSQTQAPSDPFAKLEAGLALGLSMNRAERPAEALAHLRSIEPALLQAGLPAEHALCQWQIAAAQRILRAEAGILERVAAAHTALVDNGLLLESMLCQRDMAIACLGVGDLERAERCLREARAWLEARGLLADAATFAVTDSARLRRRGQHAEALEVLAQAETVFAGEDLPGELAAVRLYQASGYLQRFDTDRAIPLLQSILPIFERLDLPLRQVMTWNELGANAACRADLAAAERAYAVSLRLSAQIQTRADHANSRLNLAVVLDDQGEMQAALEQFRAARAVYEELGDRPNMALCLSNIGIVQRGLGQYGLALRNLEAARQELRALGVKEFEPHIAQGLGRTWLALGEHELARKYLQEAEAGYQARGANFGAGRALLYLGLIEAEGGQFESALQLIEQARARITSSRAAGVLAICDQMSGQIHIRAGRVAEGLAALAGAEAEFIRLGLPINALAAATAQADGLAQRGQEAHAETRYSQVLAKARSALPELTWRAASGLANLAEKRLDRTAALGWHQQGMRALRTMRANLQHENLVDVFLSRRQAAIDSAIASALSAAQPEVALGFVEESRAQLLAGQQPITGRAGRGGPDAERHPLRREMAEIRRKLSGTLDAESSWSILRSATAEQSQLLAQLDEAARAYSAYSALAASQDAPAPADDFDLDRLRAALNAAQPRGWACLAYHWLQDELLTFVIDDGRLSLTRARLNPLQRLALELCTAAEPDRRRAIYGDAGAGPSQASRRYRELLYSLLIPETLRARLVPDKLLLVVPAGPLHALPFQALLHGSTYLCEQCILAVAPSLAAVRAPASIVPTAAPALVVAIDDFGQEQPALPNAQHEAQVVSARLPGARLLANGQATPGAVRDHFAAHPLAPVAALHFATHAVLEAGYGRLSRLVLSGGDLLADEIAASYLPARLVVLAACQAALGRVHAGGEVIGLTQAFYSAGAHNVLSALWSVADDDSPAFMDDFYAAFATRGQPPPAALAEAQRRWIEAGRPASTWAAYRVFGAP